MKSLTNLKKMTLILIALFHLIVNESCTASKDNSNAFKADMVVSWNKLVMEIAVAEDGLLTLKGVRTSSIMFIAMHDALNSINPIYSYYTFNQPSRGANPIAAAAQAAYEVVVNQYADKQPQLEKELTRWLSSVDNDDSRKEGIAIGKAAALKILKQRKNDGWDGEAEYKWHPMGPGVYAEFSEHSGTPEGFIFGAGMATARPFMLPKQDYFRSPPTPAIDSEEYTTAFNEVKEVGHSKSNTRTQDQAHLAMWWKDFIENSHNRLTREIVITENLNLWKAVRMFALLNMSICDAYINVFENKFFYNHWRPYTAIRWAENDGNENTKADLRWNNLHKHTYAFPSYPSAHGTASAAAMMILENLIGKDYHFTMTTTEVDKAGPMSPKIPMQPVTRSFKSFMEAAMEASMSRVYLGIHFRYDSIEGFNLGSKIGTYALQNFLTPLK
jgi:hypothetical protein